MTIIKTPPLQGSPPPVRSQILRDFTGGLNFRDVGATLPKNDVVDAHDVDLLPTGGFKRRWSFRPLGSSGLTSTLTPQWLKHYPIAGTTGQTLVGGIGAAHDKLAVWTTTLAEGNAPDATLTFTTDSTLGQTWSAAVMPRKSSPATPLVWIRRDTAAPTQQYLPGTSALSGEIADSHGAYNETIASPTGNHFPHSSIVCAHLDYMFHADLTEAGVRYPNKVRFSHPGEPGDYRVDDNFFVGEGQDNDVITALVSAYGALFVFKRRSVWMITGLDHNTFSSSRIAYGIGAANKNAVAMMNGGLYFWDQMLGVHSITYARGASGRVWMAQPMWGKMHNAILEGRFTNEENVALVASGTRLFVVGLNDSAADLPNVTYVMNAEAGEGYTAYDVGMNLGCDYVDQFGLHHLMGSSPYRGATGATKSKDRVVIHEFAPNTLPDKYNTVTVNYNGTLTHTWVDGGDQSLKKRFRRFSVVFDNMPAASTIGAVAYKNWDASVTARTYTITPDAVSFVAGVETNKRSGTIGTCYATAVKLTGPNDVDWRVKQITHRFIPQRIV